jgi:hypothetical protein
LKYNVVAAMSYRWRINQGRRMRVLIFAIASFVSTTCVHSQDVNLKQLQEQTVLIKPETAKLIACLSDVVDRSKAQGVTETAFKEALFQSCPNQREELRKAFLDRIIPTLNVDEKKTEELATWAAQLPLVPIYNEFTGQVPYRYRLKDAEKAKTPTPEDIEFRSAKEMYTACLSKLATNAKVEGTSADDFKKSLNGVCLEEAKAVHGAQLRVWETYASPPTNKDAAGKVVISLAKMAPVRQYGEASK